MFYIKGIYNVEAVLGGDFRVQVERLVCFHAVKTRRSALGRKFFFFYKTAPLFSPSLRLND